MEYTEVLNNMKKIKYNFPNKEYNILNFNKWMVLDYINDSYPLCNIEFHKILKNHIKFQKKYNGAKRTTNWQNTIDHILINRPLYSNNNKVFLKSSRIVSEFKEDDELSLFVGLSVMTSINNKPFTCVLQCGITLHKKHQYDWKYLIIDKEQNTYENGYGKDNLTIKGRYNQIWAQFYGIDYFPIYTEIKQDPRYINLGEFYMDTYIYKKRLEINVLTFLKEANRRANKLMKKVSCYVDYTTKPIIELEKSLLVEVYIELLDKYPSLCRWIGKLYFRGIGYMPVKNEKVTIIFTKQPYWELQEPMVINSEWEIGSYPGGKYWVGEDTNLGMVPWIGNPDINANLRAQHTVWV